MQTLRCVFKAGRIDFRIVMRGWLTPGWILSAVVLILAFGMTPAARVVHALDAGRSPVQQQITQVELVLVVDTSDPKLNRLCIGETVRLPVRVAMQTIAFTGDGEYAGFVVRNANVETTVANSVVSAVQSRFTEESIVGEPFRVYVELTGEETGRSTVNISARVDASVVISMGEELVVAFPTSAQPAPRSVDVRVVPCEYRLDIGSIWLTSMHGAFTVLIANAHGIPLTGCSQSDTCEFEPPLMGTPFLEWTWANNRIIGCLASGGHFNSRAPNIRLQRAENSVEVTIDYSRAVPGDSNSPYYRNLCLPHFTVGTSLCSERPDGYCWTMPPRGDWFEPQQPAPSTLHFSLDGGTATTSHLINHSWGSANGTIHVTLTPVRLQQ